MTFEQWLVAFQRYCAQCSSGANDAELSAYYNGQHRAVSAILDHIHSKPVVYVESSDGTQG